MESILMDMEIPIGGQKPLQMYFLRMKKIPIIPDMKSLVHPSRGGFMASRWDLVLISKRSRAMKRVCFLFLCLWTCISHVRSEVYEVDEGTLFNQILPNCTRPVLIDFYATWCGPCRSYSPVVEKVSRIYKGQIDCYRVDIDNSPMACEYFEIESIPLTVIIYTDEGHYFYKSGYMDISELRRMVREALKNAEF